MLFPHHRPPFLIGLCLCAASAASAQTATAPAKSRQTTLAVRGEDFLIDGKLTCDGRKWNGQRIEGLLMNARLVQGIFDDLNPETRGRWKYPDGEWDPDRNTREFVAAMPAWRKCGLLSFTINLQGGSPEGYSKDQPWINSAFDVDGSLREPYVRRLELILDRADELGMAPIVGLFYNVHAARLKDELAVRRAVENATDWLVARGYRNVMVEIANESDIAGFRHKIINTDRVTELIRLVQDRSKGKVKSPAGRLLAGDSFTGSKLLTGPIVEASDFILLHGNAQKEPEKIRRMIAETRKMKEYRGQPILFNEDDHYDFDKPDNNMLAAVSQHASWGYFDFRRTGEKFDEGYQSVPVKWSISSDRKRVFFTLLAEMTGGEKPAQ